ncbi:MAG: hypothetical protein MAG451_00022 [Anaerolineales bacterium]|nr:hypothetical protein [Anaerolineales bacterium]
MTCVRRLTIYFIYSKINYTKIQVTAEEQEQFTENQ